MSPQNLIASLNAAEPSVEWPSALVAIGLIGLIGVIMIVAMIRYPVNDALKIWGGLAVLVGVMTGSFGTYFFTRQVTQARIEQKDFEIAQMKIAREPIDSTTGMKTQIPSSPSPSTTTTTTSSPSP